MNPSAHTFISILIPILILILIILFILYYSKENMSFTDDYMKSTYKNMNIKLDVNDMSISKNNKKIFYLYNTNSLSSREICNNKAITSQVLKNNNIPVANFILLRKSTATITPTALIDIELKRNPLAYPLVIKPVDGSHGNDVIVGIQNISELKQKISDLLLKTDAVIIEEQLTGHDHRVLVVNNSVVDIVRRDYISITGDGVNTIQQLIDIRNKKQKEKGDHPTHNIDWKLIKRDSGLDASGVLSKNKTVMISNVRNYHNGANIIRVDLATVHPDNIEMLCNVNEAIGLNLAGVDLMIPDITQSYKLPSNKGTIIEVNSNPGLDIHVNPKDNRSALMGELVVEHLFSQETYPIVL